MRNPRRVSPVVLLMVVCFSVVTGAALGAVPTMVTIAGTGVAGYSGDGGAATAAQLDTPAGVAVDADGNVVFSDAFNDRIRMVDAVTGDISTIAGTGFGGFSGDGAAATAAQLDYPEGIAFDGDGNLYIADTNNNRIRRIDAVTGFISTIAGTGAASSTGDGADATLATIKFPTTVAVDGDDNVYVVEMQGGRIRKIDAGTGDISTVAGVGTAGFSGDGADATAAELNLPQGVGVDGDGNVYIADTLNHRVRKVDIATGDIDTIVGTGTQSSTGNGGDAASATIDYPTGIAFDAAGNLYIVENSGDLIRRVDKVTNTITTVAPVGGSYLNGPYQAAFDTDGNLFVAEANGHRVVVLATADTDGDGFADLEDNFPDVFSECRGRQATIIGTDGVDNPLNGTTGNDVIMGFDGADLIAGLSGDDLICAGNGADTVFGGDGKDKIYGENGADYLFGNAKSDRLYGGNNDDVLQGGDGTRDRLYGGSGVNNLDGGAGGDDRCTLGVTFNRCEVVF